jgi:hypothetical protein
VALALAFGILDNWVRVLLLVLIAHFSEMESDLVRHHGNFGWWVFAVGLLPYFWLAARIERRTKSPSSAARTAGEAPKAPVIMRTAPLLAGGLMLILWVGMEQLQQRHGAASAGLELPVAGKPATALWMPEYTGQDRVQTWRLPVGARVFDLTALTYVEQLTDKKLIYYSNRIADDKRIRYAGHVDLASGFAVNTALLDADVTRQVWWFWWVDGSTSTSALRTKLLQLQAMLFGDPSAALIVLSARCTQTDCRQALVEPDTATRELLLALRAIKVAR